MPGFGDERQDSEASARYTRTSSTLYCSTHDNCCAARGDGDNQTSNLEDCDTGQEDSFEGKVLVCLSPERLECSQTHEKGRSILTNLVLAMEFVRDRRDCCSYNSLR